MDHQPDGYHTITAQSVTPDPRATIEFIEKVFGGEVVEMYESEGVVHHAEVTIGDSRLMLGTASERVPEFTVSTHTYVPDVDAAYAAALKMGAVTQRQPEDQFYGDRTAVVTDRQGNQWSIATHLEQLTPEQLQQRFDEMSS